ncbi:MAG: hypothetical protein IPJ65_10295 [Archangiaceae bacterium]|nr:hypothetical protein [Archangiaceae bacterium]
MTDELLALLTAMKSHAERERSAIRYLNARSIFELATEGEGLARKLGQLLSKADASVTGSKQWGEICVRAGEVRAIARANAELMRRSLELIRASKGSHPGAPTSDAPSFVSRVA